MAALVAVVMGSRSDWETMQHAVAVLDELEVATSSGSCRPIARPGS